MILPIFGQKKEKKEETIAKPITLKDILAPASFVVAPNYVRVGKRYARTYNIFSLPRYLHVAWLSPVINLDVPLDLAIYINPYPTELYLKQLLRKATEYTAEIQEREMKGKIRDPEVEIGLRDIEILRDKLQSGEEKVFKVGFYLTTYGNDEKELKDIENVLRSILESKLIYIRPTIYKQKEGFTTTAPYCLDRIQVFTTLNTEPLSSTFPFTSFDLSANEGIMYGINLHNNSLILFDRFSLENANMVVFGKSGSGKSYFVKLDALRSLMMGAEVIIVDPENEYKRLAEAVGGTFINISLSSPHHINPLDLPVPRPDENPAEVLRSNILNLVGLMRIMLEGMTPEEDAIMDRALTETYAAKDITPRTDPRLWPKRIPLLEDLERVLEGMEGAESLVRRLRRYTRGTFAQFFNQPTNITTDKQLVVFGVRDMEEELRPIAMFLILRYIWNKVRSELKKRIAIIDEAWWIMKNEDGASFLFGLCKRARKYWLGVTTITQDVNDFMASTYGQPIITNSSIQILMKQSPATIDIVQKTFNLTDEEKYLLLECEVGQGIFFAGQKHVLMKVVASYIEDQIITTSPEELAKIRSMQQ